MRSERIVVTGAAGFIGSHLCELLSAAGADVSGVDNFDPYYEQAVKLRNVEAIRRAGCRFFELDVRDYDPFAALLDVASADIVVHLAAKAGVRNSVNFPRQYFETNVIGTQNVLDACRAGDIESLVIASISSVYGDTEQIPFREDGPAVSPKHPYAASKRCSEILASTYSHLYGMNIAVARFFTVYGPRGRPDMMPYMLLEGTVNQRPVKKFAGDLARDWTYVEDVCRGVQSLALQITGFDIVNIGRGNPVRLDDFILQLEQTSGRKMNITDAPRPASEMLVTFADTTKAQQDYGIQASVDIAEGVGRLWDWWSTRDTMAP